MKAARLLPPLLAGATIMLVAANALPSIQRKHRMQIQHRRLVRHLASEKTRCRKLRAEVFALLHDRFYLQRLLAETWHGIPTGAISWEPGKETE